MTVTRIVRDIDASDRRAIEHVLGRTLHEGQQVVITVQPAIVPECQGTELPVWLNLYEGLSEQEVAGIESSILHRDHSFRSE